VQQVLEAEMTSFLGAGSFERSEKALVLSMLQMCTEGVLTSKVSTITDTLCGLEVSRSQVSALSEKLDLELSAWLNRGLENAYPYW
jgi:putative transposase